MKKLFLLLLVLPLMFVSCGGDDDDDKSSSLSNTVWVGEKDNVTSTLTFTSNVNCTYALTASNVTITNKYTYEVSDNTVNMYPEKTNDAQLRGLIDNNTMSIINTSTGKTINLLTRR